MKKIILFLLFFQYSLHLFCHIETDRTIWIPWTTEHTEVWELIEQQDQTISHFRRNDFFEDINDLIKRDANWLQLRKHIIAAHNNALFFPDLGFAILRKSDHMFIGIIRTKLSEKDGVLNFSYGLRPEVRNDKFGQEIIKAFTHYIDQLLTIPVVTFKQGIDKSIFMVTWRTEGIKEQPDFDYLADFFDEKAQPLQKIIGYVNAQNPASLAVLLHSSMQPFALDCDKYICADGKHYFSYDFLLQYPAATPHPCDPVEQLTCDMLSRNDARIQSAHHHFNQLFHVGSSWDYILLSRAEKTALDIIERNSSRYDCTATKNIISRTYYPPHCFMR